MIGRTEFVGISTVLLARTTQGAFTTRQKMVAFKSFRWTLVGLFCGGLITVAGLAFNYATPDRVWPVRVIAFAAQLGIWAMRDWYPAHYIDTTPWASNIGLVIGGALQWGAVGLVCDLSRWLADRRTRMSVVEPNALRIAQASRGQGYRPVTAYNQQPAKSRLRWLKKEVTRHPGAGAAE